MQIGALGDIRARGTGERSLDASMVVQRLDTAGDKVGFAVERRGSVVALVVGLMTLAVVVVVLRLSRSYPPAPRRMATASA